LAVIILVEDTILPSRQPPLGELISQCVADDLGGSPYEHQKKIIIHSCKGDAKVLKTCQEQYPNLRKKGAIIATIDRDKVCRLLNIAHGSCRTKILQTFNLKIDNKTVEFILIEDNMESLLLEITKIIEIEEKIRQDAMNKKINARDIVLQKMAFSSKERRDKLRGQLPFFDRIIRKTIAQLTAQRAPA
jgi:hypothetical protein